MTTQVRCGAIEELVRVGDCRYCPEHAPLVMHLRALALSGFFEETKNA